ncbi:FCD domain protein [mine drainage metagenome]|uniref:FCD domain protein n=1 Tax=mine drainage metagenome TaxID=410659 RepID=A0A1J5PYM4_9ZZZZ
MQDDQQAAQLVDFQLVLECGLAARACGELDLDDLATLAHYVEATEVELDPGSFARADAHFHLALATLLGGWRARERQSDLLGKLCLLLPKPPMTVAREQNLAHAQLLQGLASGSIEIAVEAVKRHARCWPASGTAESLEAFLAE